MGRFIPFREYSRLLGIRDIDEYIRGRDPFAARVPADINSLKKLYGISFPGLHHDFCFALVRTFFGICIEKFRVVWYYNDNL